MNQTNEDFDFVKINLASPKRIQEWAERLLPTGQLIGEVLKPFTLNYRSLKPEMNGLFCERIFGPVKSWECHCGQYKHVRRKNLVCEQCGVDLTESRVRRHRMGYVGLMTPVTHVWYLKGVPSYLAHILESPLKDIEDMVYNQQDKKDFSQPEAQAFSIQDFLKGQNPKVGAELLYESLKEINLQEKVDFYRQAILSTPSSDKNFKTYLRRFRIFDSFLLTKSRPEWMVLTILPVLPPALRPIVQLEGGMLATSDLTELYRTVIRRNDRLKRLLASRMPGMVVRAEKHLIQEAVDALIDNGKQGPKTTDLNNRPLKSLADTVEGKQGRFRLNLLGKRVDYSGRSVIVVGPDLDLNECGLPYEMALELFYPFIIHYLMSHGFAGSIGNAKKFILSGRACIRPLVQNLIRNHPILLNRAPTLHRLGIQAFMPVLVRGRAIQLHPMVCPAFNADFDGDQMGVHIPLSFEAQVEARLLLLTPHNFLSVASGTPVIQPTQDMLLGCYYLSLENSYSNRRKSHYFGSLKDVVLAYHQNQIQLHSSVWVRGLDTLLDTYLEQAKETKIFHLADKSILKVSTNLQLRETETGERISYYIRTTPGRLILKDVFEQMETFSVH